MIVPVYNEPEAIWRRALLSVVANCPFELIAVVDGGDAALAAIAREHCDHVVRIAKAGKRAAIAAGLRATDPETEIVIVLDSDTVWAEDALAQLLLPFADPRVGGLPVSVEVDPASHHRPVVRRLPDRRAYRLALPVDVARLSRVH